MSPAGADDSAEELFEDAPCGFAITEVDGTLVRVNGAFEWMTGRDRTALLDGMRLRDLLTAGARLYHETHLTALLQVRGNLREVALELLRPDGSRLPILLNSVLVRDADGAPRSVRTTVFDASERRRYERELLDARRREQDIAQRLQRSLLTGDLPSDPQLQIDVAYNSAVTGTEVGGDWYDAFWLREGRTVGLVVGDVVGRGIEAAATMGQLRSALRALASTGLGPGALLDALDGFSRRHAVGSMTTVVCAELDLETHTLRFACAGHPPPVITVAGQAPHLAWEGRSVPLNCVRHIEPRPEGVCRLGPGGTVLLYTDGLIERRSVPITDDLDRLVACVAEHRHEPVAELSTTVMREMRDADELPDDVCVLAARLCD